MPTWTAEVASLAPDASSINAARGVAVASLWSEAGHDDRAAWGSALLPEAHGAAIERRDLGAWAATHDIAIGSGTLG